MRDFYAYDAGAIAGRLRRPEGGRVAPWDPPSEVETESAFVLPIAQGQLYPTGNPYGVLRAEGRWAHADFWVNVSEAWGPVVMRLSAVTGGWEQILDEKLVSDLENPRLTTGKIEGILFRTRGTPCDAFVVRAFPINRELSGADAGQFRFRVWGEDDSCGADRASREAVDLYAHPHQQWYFPTAAPAALAVGAPTPISVVNPTGGKSALRGFWIASNDAVARRVLVNTTGGTRNFTVFTPVGGGTVSVELPEPAYSLRGEQWFATLAALSGGASVFISAEGHFE